MIYSGSATSVSALDNGLAELKFDLANESVNKFSAITVQELAAASEAIKADSSIKGVVVTSGKSVFIVGADITEFVGSFKKPESEIKDWVVDVNDAFNRFEDLPFPKVAAINGAALGGGCEMTLVCEYRVMSDKAIIGLPETQLGIFQGLVVRFVVRV